MEFVGTCNYKQVTFLCLRVDRWVRLRVGGANFVRETSSANELKPLLVTTLALFSLVDRLLRLGLSRSLSVTIYGAPVATFNMRKLR